ncbi:MAG: MraY family glycosyltransferase [Candidatus Omnitrophota bacterium]|nr:MraY family glycosyltransferase [Candidatus Omnitrophota bacterium]
MDNPGQRKIHQKPIPLLGGIAIFASYSLALLLNFHFSWELKGVVIASFLILAAGLWDDVRELPAWVRLFVQIFCSLIVVWFGVRLNIVPDHLPFARSLETVITVIWIVGITNALNFMDGIDGLAAGLAFIASGAFFIVAYQTGQGYFAFLSIALAGACLGFLFFNFHPAKIFLGDAGSSFIGFSLASLAVMGEWAESNPIVALSIPLLILAVLIFDMIYISISRIAHGKVRNFREWIEHVDMDHLHHRLIGLGLTQVQAVFFIYLVSIVFALGALVLKNATTLQALLLLLQCFFVLVIVTVLMLVGRRNIRKNLFSGDRLKEIEDNELQTR